MPSHSPNNNFLWWSLNEWLMQPNSWNKKIPEVSLYGVKTWGVERQTSGSSYDFIRRPLSNLPNFHLSPSFPPPPTLFLAGPTQEVRLHLWLDEVFPQTHVFLTPHMDLALSLFLPEVSLAFSLLVVCTTPSLFSSCQLLMQKETPEGGVMWDSSACWALKLPWFRWFRQFLWGSKLCREE